MSFGKGQRDDTKNNFLSKDTKARNNEAKRKQDDGWDGQGFFRTYRPFKTRFVSSSWIVTITAHRNREKPPHGYMKEKERKLEEQFDSLNNDQHEISRKSDIFNGVCIFVNGYTNPSSDHLKKIMADHGGRYQHYYSMRSCTHIIATNLPDSKVKKLKNEKVVHPDWILESVEAEKLLPINKYRLYCTENGANSNVFGNFRCSKKNSADGVDEADSSVFKEFAQHQRPLSGNSGDFFTPEIILDYDNSVKNNETPFAKTVFHSDSRDLSDGDCKSDVDERVIGGNDIEKQNPYDTIMDRGSDSCMAIGNSDVTSKRFDDCKPEKQIGPHEMRMALPNLTKHDYSKTSPSKTMGKAGDPGFMSEFYSNSRLHHLSMWRSELKRFASMIHRASANKEKSARKKSEQCIVHVDLDSFFVSVAVKEKPELKGKPVAVCHASKGSSSAANMNSMSEIASCSYEARSKGVRNGMFLGTARAKCPELICVPYYFESYRTVSQKFYEILASYTGEIEAVSCDEALLDISDIVNEKLTALEFAAKIRNDVLLATGCTSSAGIACNILLARMATRKAKPNGQFHLQNSEIKEFLGCQQVSDLPGVGHSMRSKLAEMAVSTCADLRQVPLQTLQAKFGPKNGQTLFNYCRGIDDRRIKTDHERQSVSAEINYGIRFTEQSESHSFIQELAKEVHERLTAIDMMGSQITLKLMIRSKGAPEPLKHMGHGICDNVSKSATISHPTNDSILIGREAINLLQQVNPCASDIRGIGIQAAKLVCSSSKTVKTIDFSKAKQAKPIKTTIPSNPVGNIREEKNRHDVISKTHGTDNRGKGLSTKRGRKPGRLNGKRNANVGCTIKNFVQRVPLTVGISKDLESCRATKASEPPLPCLNFSPAKETNRGESYDLPPLSEIDPSVFNELPEDVKQSIAEAYKHRNEVLSVKGCSLDMPKLNVSPSSQSKSSMRSATCKTGITTSNVYKNTNFTTTYPEQTSRSATCKTGITTSNVSKNTNFTTTYPEQTSRSATCKTGITTSNVSKNTNFTTTYPEQTSSISKRKNVQRSAEDFTSIREANEDDLLSESRLDPEVMAALPENLRQEVLDGIKLERRINQKKRNHSTAISGCGKREEMEGGQTADVLPLSEKSDFREEEEEKTCLHRSTENESHHIHERDEGRMMDGFVAYVSGTKSNISGGSQIDAPSLCGKTSYEDCKAMIKKWIQSTDEPLREDVDGFTRYLEDLVICKNMEQAFLLLKLFKRLCTKSKQWENCWVSLDNQFEQFVTEIYGARFSL